jgi:S-DNA-T family DNA segregation ATPase FtsK/SpoIIIE
LVSYNPCEEPTISKNVVIHNWMGIAGVYVSHWLMKYTIGIASFIIPFLIVLWGLWCLSRGKFKPLIRFTFCLLVLSLVISTALALPAIKEGGASSVGFRYSGLIGGVIAKTLNDFFGFPGAIIITVVVALVAIRGYFSWSFFKPFKWLFRRRKAKAYGKRDTTVEKVSKIPDSKIKPFKSTQTSKLVVEKEEESFSRIKGQYRLPGLELLNPPSDIDNRVSKYEMNENARLIE